MTNKHAGIKASLFVTCISDVFYPEVGESTYRVLKRLGVDVSFPEDQTCCGQPQFNSGFRRETKSCARHFLDVFAGDDYIVTPSGSCASMVRHSYAQLFRDEPVMLERVNSTASRVFEFSEFIVDVLGVTDPVRVAGVTETYFRGKVCYHESCHLKRDLGISSQPKTLIHSVPGVEFVEMEQADTCCGFGGTFAVKYADISGAMLKDKVKNIRASGADYVIGCDLSCLMNIGGGLDKEGSSIRTLHIARLLDIAMGIEQGIESHGITNG